MLIKNSKHLNVCNLTNFSKKKSPKILIPGHTLFFTIGKRTHISKKKNLLNVTSCSKSLYEILHTYGTKIIKYNA